MTISAPSRSMPPPLSLAQRPFPEPGRSPGTTALAGTPPPPSSAGAAGPSKLPVLEKPSLRTMRYRQKADQLIAAFNKGPQPSDRTNDAVLRTPNRFGTISSTLDIICRVSSEEALAFLAKVLLPAVVEKAKTRHDGQSVDSKAFTASQESAGRHLKAGIKAALAARNAKALSMLLLVAQELFPRHLDSYIRRRLTLNPGSAATFVAAGISRGALDEIRLRKNPEQAEAVTPEPTQSGENVQSIAYAPGPVRIGPPPEPQFIVE